MINGSGLRLKAVPGGRKGKRGPRTGNRRFRRDTPLPIIRQKVVPDSIVYAELLSRL